MLSLVEVRLLVLTHSTAVIAVGMWNNETVNCNTLTTLAFVMREIEISILHYFFILLPPSLLVPGKPDSGWLISNPLQYRL